MTAAAQLAVQADGGVCDDGAAAADAARSADKNKCGGTRAGQSRQELAQSGWRAVSLPV